MIEMMVIKEHLTVIILYKYKRKRWFVGMAINCGIAYQLPVIAICSDRLLVQYALITIDKLLTRYLFQNTKTYLDKLFFYLLWWIPHQKMIIKYSGLYSHHYKKMLRFVDSVMWYIFIQKRLLYSKTRWHHTRQFVNARKQQTCNAAFW